MALESKDVNLPDQDHNDSLLEWDDEIIDEYGIICSANSPPC